LYFTTKGPNLAKEKDAKQSTTHWFGRASRAVDGDTSVVAGKDIDKQCAVSKSGNGSPAWWSVDLGSFYPLTGITIYNINRQGTQC